MSDTTFVDPDRLDLPSASAFEILAECSGQVQMKKNLPPEAFHVEAHTKDELTDRGTRIHKARETMNALPLSAEEAELYQAGLRCEEKLLDKWRELHLLKPDEIREGERELRLWLHHPSTLEPMCSGQLDVHYVSNDRKHALVVDWKTGFCSNLVSAPGNWQLRLQAVLLKGDIEELETIRVAFAKPMFENSDLDYVDYSVQDLKYSLESILYQLWWSTQPDAPRRAGSHCRYCPAKAYCPEALAWALLPSVMAQVQKAGRSTVVKLDGVDAEDLYRLWRGGSVIRKILDSVTERLKGWPDEQLALIGVTHGEGREMIEFTDSKGLFEHLEKEMWTEEQIWSAVEFSIGKLSRVAGSMQGISEDEAKTLLKEELRAFYTTKKGEKILKLLKGQP